MKFSYRPLALWLSTFTTPGNSISSCVTAFSHHHVGRVGVGRSATRAVTVTSRPHQVLRPLSLASSSSSSSCSRRHHDPNNLPFLLRTSSSSISSFAATTSLRMSSNSSTSSQEEGKDVIESEKTSEEKVLLRVALCQFHVTEDKPTNYETCAKYVQMAADDAKAQLVVLPEIWNSPYATSAFPDYAEPMPSTTMTADDDEATTGIDAESMPTSKLLQDLAIKHNVWLIGGSIPERSSDNQKIYNTCLVFNPDGKIVAKHSKIHLFDIDVPGGITFKESETLTGGNTVSYFTIPDMNVNINIGLGICYDIRFAEYAMLLRQKHNCGILIYPGAFNLTTGPAHWELLQRARALDNQCYVMMCSPARTVIEDVSKKGKYPHYTAWGHSTVVSPWGDIVATTNEEEGLVVTDIDLKKIGDVRQSIPIGNQRRTDIYQLEEI